MTNPDYPIPDDWRGKVLTQFRKAFEKADPEISEEVKYKTASNPSGVLVWYKNGMLSTGETYKAHLRFAFTKGPELKKHDPKNLINSYRAIIVKEGDKIDNDALIELIRAAASLND